MSRNAVDLKIHVIDTKKHNIKQNQLMIDKVIPAHPFRLEISGASGSGKSNLLSNLMTRFYKNYFSFVFLFSPTGAIDDLAKTLKLRPQNIFTDMSTAQTDLQRIYDKQESIIKNKGIDKSPRVCIIFDDIIASRTFLMSSKMLKSAAMSRHYNCSLIFCSQSYNKIPRPIRMQLSHLMFFPSKASEVELVSEEFAYPGATKWDMKQLIQTATSERFNFLGIFVEEDASIRYRKNLDQIIGLPHIKSNKK
jgi:hypothetical protein